MPKLHDIPNSQIAEILREIAVYLDVQNVAFKPRAYEKAADTVSAAERSLAEIYTQGGIKALKEMPGIGEAIAEKIEELLLTGRLKYYDKLKKELPVNIEELQGIGGLGPKSIARLYKELKVRTLADLERAAKNGRIAELSGFGEKSQEKILQSIEFKKSGTGRTPIFLVMPVVEKLSGLISVRPGVERFAVAGSVRRAKETIGDVDMLVVAKNPKAIMDYFTAMPGVMRVLAHGDTKSSVQLGTGLQIDMRVVPKESYGAALNYFTGSKEHNVALRQLAIDKGMKLNEYGLWKDVRGKEKMVAGKSEEEVYAALGLKYVEPELRENTGEIEAARRNELPDLVKAGDLRGDLQVQSDWTDGSASIEAMAKAAMQRGLEYIAITDHTSSLAMVGGLDARRIKKQWLEIDRVNRSLRGKFTVLKGTECDILPNGKLDLPDEILAQLDVVGVSVHYRGKLSRAEQTKRILRAMENPHVDILFHPTGRIVGRRPPYEVDMEAVIQAAKKKGVVLEVNAMERLDLKDEHVRMAVRAGVKLSIDSDAHAPNHFDLLHYGVSQARRGWAEKADVINTKNAASLHKILR